MDRRTRSRGIAAVLVGAALTAGALAATFGGAASADVPAKAPAQVATPPAPGSGVTVIVENPPPPPPAQPLGPVSFT